MKRPDTLRLRVDKEQVSTDADEMSIRAHSMGIQKKLQGVCDIICDIKCHTFIIL